MVIALAVLAAFIAGSALIAAVIDGDGASEPRVVGEGEEAGTPPEIVPKPNSGDAPEEAGDRGGWGQLLVLGLIVVAVAGIGFAVTRGSKRSRANRAAWLAAAESDEDGSLDRSR